MHRPHHAAPPSPRRTALTRARPRPDPLSRPAPGTPSSSRYLGLGDEAFYYPAGRRSYAFSADKGADHAPFEITTSDNQRMTVSGVLTFFLNTDCEVLKTFHTEVGRKNWAGQPAFIASEGNPFTGWDAMLDITLGQPLQATLGANAQQYPTLNLYRSEDTRNRLEQAVVASLPAAVSEAMGGDYFIRYTLTLQRPVPPQAMVEALEREATARTQKDAVARENELARERYRRVVECIRLTISAEQCVLLYGIDTGEVQVLPYGTPVLPRSTRWPRRPRPDLDRTPPAGGAPARRATNGWLRIGPFPRPPRPSKSVAAVPRPRLRRRGGDACLPHWVPPWPLRWGPG